MVINPRPSLPLLVGVLMLLAGPVPVSAPLLFGVPLLLAEPLVVGGSPAAAAAPLPLADNLTRSTRTEPPTDPLQTAELEPLPPPGRPLETAEPEPPPHPPEPLLVGEPEPRFSWPLSPAPRVTRPFQRPETDYGPGHRGVDLAAAPGQQVLAAGPGVVVFSGQVAGQGVVSIDHDGGLRTTYEPVSPTVPAGTQVFTGQPIATVAPGHPGCPVAACLHWGVRRGDEYLNPLALIRTESVIRLKPWDPP